MCCSVWILTLSCFCGVGVFLLFGFFVLGAGFETVSLCIPSCPEVSLPPMLVLNAEIHLPLHPDLGFKACATTTQSCEVSPILAYFLLEPCRLICRCTRVCLCPAVCDTGPRAGVPWQSGLSRAWSSSFKDYTALEGIVTIGDTTFS